MVDTVTGRLHLFPRHIGHTKATSGCPDAFAGFQIVRGKFWLPFLQKLRHFGKAHPIAIMGGVLPILMQHHDIRYGQGVPGEVCRAVHIEPGINAFQIVLRRQRRFVDQLVIFRIHGKAVAADTVQRLETIVQRFIAAFELINGKAVFRSLILNGLGLCHDIRRSLHIGGCRCRILPFRSFRSSQHFIHAGFNRVLQSGLDLRHVKVKKFLIARGVLEFFDLRRKIVLLCLPQRRQLFIQSGNASGHQIFVKFLLCGMRLRVLRCILRIVLTEKLIHVKGDIHSPLGFFFFGKIVLKGHHPVLVGDTAALTVVILMETVTRITHIALIREGAVFLQRNVPAVGLIVDVILQMLWHLHNVQFFDVIAAQIVIVMDIGVNLIAIQILGEVDDLLQAAAMVAHFHTGLKLCVFAFAHFIQLRCQIIQFVQIFIFTQLTVKTVHIAVIVRDEPFLIGLAEVIFLADPDPLKHFFQFLGGGGKLHPLAHKFALIVLPKIGDKGGKGIILVVIVIWHISTSLQFRRRLFLIGLRLVFLRTFLLALFQPFPDGRLFLRLRRAFMVPLVAGKRNISVFRKMALFLLHGILAKRNRVDRFQKFRGQQHIHVLCQIPPPQIIQIVDVGFKHEIVDVGRKLLELLRRCQLEGRGLHRR